MSSAPAPTLARLQSVHDALRREASVPGLVLEPAPGLVLLRTADGEGMVVATDLEASEADAAIHEQLERSARLGTALEWIVYSPDRPADLSERLERHGFTCEGTEAILMLELGQARPPALQAPIDVRRVNEPAQIEAVAHIRSQVFGEDADSIRRRLSERLTQSPDSLEVFLAYAGEVPAATAQITYFREQAVGSLVSAATLPEFRRQGLYSALLTARIEAARSAGMLYLEAEASPMSRPTLKRAGFLQISEATTWAWQPV